MSQFVDTNVIITLLTEDDPQKAKRCLELFQQVKRGEATLVTSEAVVAEIAYALTSRTTYAFPRELVAATLRPILVLPRLRMDEKATILRALDLWEEVNLDFADCLAIEHMRRLDLDAIYSYDRGLDRLPGIRRLEP